MIAFRSWRRAAPRSRSGRRRTAGRSRSRPGSGPTVNGALSARNQSSGTREDAAPCRSARVIATHLRHLLAEGDVERRRQGEGDREGDRRGDPVETSPREPARSGVAIAGSPRNPIPIEAIVIPIWQVGEVLVDPVELLERRARRGGRPPRPGPRAGNAASARARTRPATNMPVDEDEDRIRRDQRRAPSSLRLRDAGWERSAVAWSTGACPIVERGLVLRGRSSSITGRRRKASSAAGDVLGRPAGRSKSRPRGITVSHDGSEPDALPRRARRATRRAIPAASTSPATREAPAPTRVSSRRSARRL